MLERSKLLDILENRKKELSDIQVEVNQLILRKKIRMIEYLEKVKAFEDLKEDCLKRK